MPEILATHIPERFWELCAWAALRYCLYGAVYSTGASTYYGFSTKFAGFKSRKYIIILGAVAGFLLGLSGFKTLVEFLYPAQGYIGMLFIALIIANFIREAGKNSKSKQNLK